MLPHESETELLLDLVDREVMHVTGFIYSEAMHASGVYWTIQELVRYLKYPKQIIPGIRVEHAGLKDEQYREDILALICRRQFDDLLHLHPQVQLLRALSQRRIR